MKGPARNFSPKYYTKNYQFTFVENESEGYYKPEKFTLSKKIIKALRNFTFSLSRKKIFDFVVVPIITSLSVFVIFLIFMLISKLTG